MLSAIIRKAKQVLGDPTLRRYLLRRLRGLESGMPPHTPHNPPYLGEVALPDPLPAPRAESFAELPAAPPTQAITLHLPGADVTLQPGDAEKLFDGSHGDIETELGAHRFAWLPLLGEKADPAWVNALWRTWAERYGADQTGWAWHPYTAAERAINLIDYGRRVGLPGPVGETVNLLAAHGPVIAANLEYFSEVYTGNHLANNGRGLYLIGLELAIEPLAEMGKTILLEEAKRIVTPAGVLRECSSHYHLLVARGYATAWLAARRFQRPETKELEGITAKALSALPGLMMPGGMPLVGDVSPDCPPSFLNSMHLGQDSGKGWLGGLSQEEREAFHALRISEAAQPAPLNEEGFHRLSNGPWSGFWHVSPEGWPFMPGHGHQDIGGFELHFDTTPLFIDPGRGAYGESGEAARYRSGEVHNTLLVDRRDPYPPNRPYYSGYFRALVGGGAPRVRIGRSQLMMEHMGFARMHGVGRVERAWNLTEEGVSIIDRVSGARRALVSRIFMTTGDVEKVEGGVQISCDGKRFLLKAEGPVFLSETPRFRAYGRPEPATRIEFTLEASLPWEGKTTLEVLN